MLKISSTQKYILTMRVCNKIIINLSQLNIEAFHERYNQLKQLEMAWSKNYNYDLIFHCDYLGCNLTNELKLTLDTTVTNNEDNIAVIHKFASDDICKQINSSISFSDHEESNTSSLHEQDETTLLTDSAKISPPKKQYKCPTCHKNLSSDLFFKRHQLRCGQKRTLCNICGRYFPRRYFKSHQARHQPTKTHSCPVCPKSFAVKGGLNQHMLSHGVVKKLHLCIICGLVFNDYTRLHKHNLEVHVGRKYGCSVCGREFTRNYDLGVHMARHSAKPQYKCEKCEKEFYTKKNLQRHLKMLHTI